MNMSTVRTDASIAERARAALSESLERRGMRVALCLGAAATVLFLFRIDPLLIPLAAGATLLAMVVARWPLIGLVCLVAMLVSNLSSLLIAEFGLPSIAKLALPGLVTLLALRYLLRGETPYVPWTFASLAGLFLAVKLIAGAEALHWEVSLDVTEGYVKDVAVVLVALAFLLHRGAFEAMTVTAPVTLALIAALGLARYLGVELPQEAHGFAQIHPGNGRFSGPIGDPNFFGALLAFATPLAIFQSYNARGAARLVGWGLVLVLLLFGLAATQSRGGMLALLVGCALLTLSMSRPQIVVTALMGVLAVVAVSATLSEAQMDRIRGVADLAVQGGTIDRATEGRLASWRVAWETFLEHPLLGIGPGNFNLYYQDLALELGLIFRGEGRSAHSLYLEQLAEVGVIGLAVFLLMIFVGALSTIRAVRIAQDAGARHYARHYAAFGAAMASYLAAMVFLHDSYPRFLLLMIGLSVELGRYAVVRHDDPAGSPPPAAAA